MARNSPKPPAGRAINITPQIGTARRKSALKSTTRTATRRRTK